jgi:hypothetical protein
LHKSAIYTKIANSMQFTPPPSWQQFVQRSDNKGLSMPQLQNKYQQERHLFEIRLAEHIAYVNYINSLNPPVAPVNQGAGGGHHDVTRTAVLTFSDISTALTQLQTAGFSGAASDLTAVADWNTHLGTTFDSVVIDGTTATFSVRETTPGAKQFAIGASKFLGVATLTSIVDGNSTFTSIEESAFQNCTGLVTVTLPAVGSIGTNAFAKCTAITTLNLNNATTIGATAFSGSTFANLVNLTSSFANVTSIGAGAFTGSTSLKQISFPAAYSLGDFAFGTCTSLATMSFATNLTSVGTTPFLNVASNGTGSFDTLLQTGSGAPASASIEYLKVTKGWNINLNI